jgi:3D (Asp-Asp-Asp) domain-containing protein
MAANGQERVVCDELGLAEALDRRGRPGVRLPAVEEPGRGLRAALVAASVVALAAFLLPAAIGAGSPSQLHERAQELRSENSALTDKARATWLSSVTLSTRLDQTRAALGRFRARREAISAQRAEAEQSLRLARRTLEVSQRRLADRLRLLYEQGPTDTMSVLVGATSVDDAINRIDNLHRIAGLDREVIDAAKAARAHLTIVTERLAAAEARARETEAATAATIVALEAAQREQAATLASVRARRSANSSQISTLESRARELAAIAGPGRAGRTLTVLATGYSLTGNTSTGVPVGYGIVAVDPGVISLGTKMTVPGYGEGVAADTGGAVAGSHIDLWFPTEAEALAWGSRTVTVTLH